MCRAALVSKNCLTLKSYSRQSNGTVQKANGPYFSFVKWISLIREKSLHFGVPIVNILFRLLTCFCCKDAESGRPDAGHGLIIGFSLTLSRTPRAEPFAGLATGNRDAVVRARPGGFRVVALGLAQRRRADAPGATFYRGIQGVKTWQRQGRVILICQITR